MKKTAWIVLLAAVWLAVFCGEAAALQSLSVSTGSELTGEMQKINGGTYPDTQFVVTLNADIEVGGISVSRPGVTVTLLGGGHTLRIGQGSIFVYSSSTSQPAVLNLGSSDGSDTLTITGEGRDNTGGISFSRNDNPGALYIQKNGVCNMYEGVTIRDVINNNYFGGGASVQGGTFNMFGGTITHCGVDKGSVCYGGGVAVYANGVFNMSGGTISDCFVQTNYQTHWMYPSGTGGGVYVGNRATFNMSGGTIANCSASMHGGGVMVQSSVFNWYEYTSAQGQFGRIDSRFAMTGGVIKDCKAENMGGGIAVFGTYDEAKLIAGQISDINKPDLVGVSISGGEISGNDAANGGGLLVLFSREDVRIDKTKILNNTADNGAGIYILSDFTKLYVDQCIITGNAADQYGGGLLIDDNKQKGYTTVTNTVLCNNTAELGASDVYVYNSAVRLPDAAGMQAVYTGKPDDVTGKPIDGWYMDEDDARYTGSPRTEFTGYASIPQDGQEYYLIAAVNPRPVTVTFDANGHGTAPQAQSLMSGDKVQSPGAIAETDWHFTGWFVDAACTTPYHFSTPLTGDLTLYAGWKQLRYTLHYNDGRPNEKGCYVPAFPKALPTQIRYFSAAEASSSSHSGVDSEGYYFLAWTRTDSEGLHIEAKTPDRDRGDIDYNAHWLKVVIDVKVDVTAEAVIGSGQEPVKVDDSQREALLKNVSLETDILGDDCRIDVIMTVTDENLPAHELASADIALSGAFGSVPENYRLDYDVSVLKVIMVNGAERVRRQLKELAEPIEITFAIPLEWQTGGRIHVFRTHTKDGVTKTTELKTLGSSASTCTVSTDEFSVYTLVFEPDQSAADALPKTGDSSSLPLLLGIALLSCLGIVLLLRRKR